MLLSISEFIFILLYHILWNVHTGCIGEVNLIQKLVVLNSIIILRDSEVRNHKLRT